jgi:hypothetical protein
MHPRVSIENPYKVVENTDSFVVWIVVNRLEEGDKVLHVFDSPSSAMAYAEMEADLNEVDWYTIIVREVMQ